MFPLYLLCFGELPTILEGIGAAGYVESHAERHVESHAERHVESRAAKHESDANDVSDASAA